MGHPDLLLEQLSGVESLCKAGTWRQARFVGKDLAFETWKGAFRLWKGRH